MSKNRISITVSAEQAQSARAGIAQTRDALPGLIHLEADERGLLFMGPQSQAFVRGCLRVLRENPQLVPPGLNLAEAEADLAAYDALRPIKLMGDRYGLGDLRKEIGTRWRRRGNGAGNSAPVTDEPVAAGG